MNADERRCNFWRLVVAGWCVAMCAHADQVTLSNGDRLSGNIENLAGEKLSLRSEMMGRVTVPWKNVATIVSTQPLYVVLKDGDTFTGSLIQAEHGFVLQNSQRT